jgi:hypothetical protein
VRRLVSIVTALVGALGARTVPAQRIELPSYVEYRADAIDGRGTTAQAGLGYTMPLGIYVRVAAIGAIGPQWRDGRTLMAGRSDLIARFLLDPFRQTPVALSIGGGVSVPYQQGAVSRPYLAAVIDVEGRRHGRLTPALQVGIGGGTRIGLGFRTSVRQRR